MTRKNLFLRGCCAWGRRAGQVRGPGPHTGQGRVSLAGCRPRVCFRTSSCMHPLVQVNLVWDEYVESHSDARLIKEDHNIPISEGAGHAALLAEPLPVECVVCTDQWPYLMQFSFLPPLLKTTVDDTVKHISIYNEDAHTQGKLNFVISFFCAWKKQ